MKKYGAVILAGGRGDRFHGKKQFFELDGKPLWRHTYDKAASVVGRERIVVVGVDIPGGQTRTGSVIAGLEGLPKDTERVILIEAARPLVTAAQIQTLLEDPFPSSSYVMPLVNTVIRRDGGYLNRNELYELLTPQAFDFQLLCAAYDSNRFSDMTDETRVMFEYHGIPPHLIQTTENLIKVTYQRDIYIVEQLMKTITGQEGQE